MTKKNKSNLRFSPGVRVLWRDAAMVPGWRPHSEAVSPPAGLVTSTVGHLVGKTKKAVYIALNYAENQKVGEIMEIPRKYIIGRIRKLK